MRPDTARDHRTRMRAVLLHLQRNLDRPLALEALARIAHFSPYHFHRIFRGMVGESVQAHIRRLRLERAAQRLKLTERTVLEIALEAGYEAHESFTRAFKAHFDVPPTTFRTRNRPLRFPVSPSGVHFAGEGDPESFQPVQGAIMVSVAIEKRGPFRVAYLRHVGPYQEVGATWGRLCAFAGQRGLFGPHARMLGVAHDDPEVTPPEKIRYDACITVPEGFEPDGDIGVQEIPPREYAVTVHAGPYENLATTYAGVCGEWLPTSGREAAAAPCLEFYLNDPNSTPPAELRTEICVPLD